MSVMESMRSGTDSTFMQVVLVLVVVSFVMWGVAPQGDRTGVVLEVNGESVYGVDFNRQLGMVLRNYERNGQGPPSNDQVDKIREDLKQSLIQQIALRQEAERLGLAVSDKEVLRAIMQQEAFKDDGVFDEERYERTLRMSGLSPAKYEAQQRDGLMLSKLETLISLGVSVSAPLVEKTFIEQNTKVTFEMVRIRPAAFQAGYTPSDAEIEAFYTDGQADIQAAYDKDYDRLYDLGERVALEVITLKVGDDGLGTLDLEPKLNGVLEALKGGADFAEQARRWSEDRSARKGGTLPEAEVSSLDEEVQKAIEGLQAGDLTDVVVTPRDLRIFRLVSRTPAKVIPLDEVKRDLAIRLLKEQAGPAKAASFAETELLPAWKAAPEGPAPAALLEANNLTVTTTPAIPLDGSGAGLFPPPPELLSAARGAEVGSVFDEVYTDASGSLYVAKLVGREDADLEELEEDRESYRERSLLIARGEFLSAYFDAVVARADVQ